jgi:hypothetical protein
MQIENNRLKEESEAAKFEMTNKILQLEIALAEAEDEKKRLGQLITSAKERTGDAEKRQKEMADEFEQLQSSNVALNAAYDKLVIILIELTQSQLNFTVATLLFVMLRIHQYLVHQKDEFLSAFA